MTARTALVLNGGSVQQLQTTDALANVVARVIAGGGTMSTGTLVFVDGGGITWGLNANSLTATVVAGAAAGIAAVSAGTQLQTAGTLSFSNANGISFGLANSSQLTASYTVPTVPPQTSLSFSNLNGISFGIAGSTLTAAYSVPSVPAQTSLSFSNANGISFGIAGSTVTAKPINVSYFENFFLGAAAANGAATASAGSNVSFQRISVPFPIAATRMDLLGHLTVAGSTAGSYSMNVAIYSFGGSTASSLSSGSVGVSFNSGTTLTAASIYGAHSGTRWRSIPLGTWNVTPGEYLVGVMVSQGGVAGTTGSWSVFGASSLSINPNVAGGDYTAYFADGIYSAATGAFPASIHLSAINQTGASVQRQPYLRMAGTF